MKKRILVLALFISASLPICAQVDLGKGFLKDKKSVETFTLAEYFLKTKATYRPYLFTVPLMPYTVQTLICYIKKVFVNCIKVTNSIKHWSIYW